MNFIKQTDILYSIYIIKQSEMNNGKEFFQSTVEAHVDEKINK